MYGRWSRYGDFSRNSDQGAFLNSSNVIPLDVTYIADREHSVTTSIDLLMSTFGGPERLSERPKGYRIANDYHNWPKHQDQEAGTLALHLLDLVISVEYHYVHDKLTTYVDLNIVVKSTPSTQPTHPSRLDEQMFEEELLGFKLNLPASNKRRTVPVLFTITPDTRARAESHAKSLKIDFQKHIREFADPLGALLRKHEVEIVESESNLPFFKPTKKLSDLKECINLSKPKL